MTRQTALGAMEDVLSPLIHSMGYDLVRLHFSGSLGAAPQENGKAGGKRAKTRSQPRSQATLQIMVERQDRANMTVRDCTRLSHAISDMLEQNDPLGSAAYLLEVSSPGLDRPLVKIQDYERFMGEVAKIELGTAQDGRKRFTGRLAGLNDAQGGTCVVLEEDGKMFYLPLSLIDKARLVITDEVMARELAKQQAEQEAEPETEIED